MLVQCRSCSKQFKVTDNMFGRKVKCTCGTVMQMPAAPSQPKPAAVAGTSAADIQFQCPKCSQRLSVPVSAAGQVTACTCGVKIRVPQAPAAPANDPYALPAEYGGVNDLDALEEIGLESGSNDPFGSSSLDNQYGLAPLSDASSVNAGAYGTPTGQPAYLQPSKPTGGRKIVRKPSEKESGGGFGINGSVLSGFGMMVGAVVWFFGGLALGRLFVYPPILFFIGLFTMISGFFGEGE